MAVAWLTIPSARPETEARACVDAWRQQGYGVAMLRNGRHACPVGADYEVFGEYPGYAQSCNRLIKEVLAMDTDAQWVICAGDDTFPDQTKRADEIATECEIHFLKIHIDKSFGGLRESSYEGIVPLNPYMKTFGVMQPTGDRFAQGSIDNIAGSPWLGREFCRRVRRGQGPYDPGYRHMFADEYIMNVAQKLGVYWMRPDLVHLHRHFMRESDAIDSKAIRKTVPEFLQEANSPKHWADAKALFLSHKASGFSDALELLP